MENHKGLTKTFTLPDGDSVTIREQNADDDEILSQIDTTSPMDGARAEDMRNLNTFITQIVTFYSKTQKAYITASEVEALKLNSKYYIVLMSRAHSLGTEIDFEWVCRNKACKHKYDVEDDLKRFIKDFSKPDDGKNDTEGAFKAYPSDAGEWVEHQVSSTKLIRFRYMTAKSELDMLALAKDTINRNTDLYARELSLKVPETEEKTGWFRLSNLGIFSKAEIGPIRKLVNELDGQAALVKRSECPKCKNDNIIPYTMLPDFFFPSEE